MNGCSSPGGPAAPALEGRVPQNVTDGDSSVTRALETVFQLQGPTVRRPPKRVQAEGLEEYPLPPETTAEQAEPDWKRRQAERIRAWRLKASLEPHLAAKEYRTGSRFQWQSKEYQARALQRPQAGSAPDSEQKASTHEEDTDLGPTQQIPEDSGQQTTKQPDASATGQGKAKPGRGRGLTPRTNHVQASAADELVLQGIPEDTGAPSGRKLREKLHSRNAETADESGDDEEACMAPCSDDENENLTLMRDKRPDKPDKVCSEKEESRANKPALVQSTELKNKFIESRSQSINRTESRLEPGLSCSATVPLKREEMDTVSISIDKDSASGMTKGELPGGSPSCHQEEVKALESIGGDQPETVAEQNDKPAADKSWVLCQAAKIRAWREAQRRGLLPAQSGINVESRLENEMKSSIPVQAATGFGEWSQITRKRVFASVEVRGEHALSQSIDQAKHVALELGSMCGVPESKQTPEAQLGVLQNTEHGEYMELASTRGDQAEEAAITPVSEHTGSKAGSKPVSDKSWALFQAAKIKAWCEAASRSGANTLPSSLNVETTFNPKQRDIGTIPVHHTKRGKGAIKSSAPNVEAMHTSNWWGAENTPEQQVYKILPGTDAQRTVELTVAQSNFNVEAVHNSKQWTVDSMHVRQGPEIMIAPKAPEREELTVTPSGSNIKWWDVESHSSSQSKGTGAEWETSSSGKSSLITRDHNVKVGQLVVDSTSVHQNPSFQPWWKAASEGVPDLERNHLNLESMHNLKRGDVESMSLCPTPGIGSWLEDTSRRNASLLNLETAHSTKWGAGESMPVRYTTGLTSYKEAASIVESAFTWEQPMTTSSQHAVDKAAQILPNDFSAWWRRVGDRASHQAEQEKTRRRKDWSLTGRRVSKLNTESHLSFVAAEKKRMQEWAQAVWNQAASK